MQNDLSSRMEKLWAMSDIALRHGTADYGFDGHSKAVRLAGTSFFFVNGILARVRAAKMDIAITRNENAQGNIIAFPGLQSPIVRTSVEFLAGDDQLLDRHFSELQMLDATLSPRKAA